VVVAAFAPCGEATDDARLVGHGRLQLRGRPLRGDRAAPDREPLPLQALPAFAVEPLGRPTPIPRLDTTSISLQGFDAEEIITAVRARHAPMMSASAGLRL
jgi:hypothetical protein